MRRSDFLLHPEVLAFLGLLAQIMDGSTPLRHYWVSKNGIVFSCDTLYSAFLQYQWRGSFEDKLRSFAEHRRLLKGALEVGGEIGKCEFLTVACDILLWGRMTLKALRPFESMPPDEMMRYLRETCHALRPHRADLSDLSPVRYMNSSLSKVYSALMPSLPIYDSRVACALRCLVRLHLGGDPSPHSPLHFRIPVHHVGGVRCQTPMTSSTKVHAEDNLKCAWLLSGMLERPGLFFKVGERKRLDAIQSALFALGYWRMEDGAYC